MLTFQGDDIQIVTKEMKLVVGFLAIIQLFEFLIYLSIHYYILNHNRTMLKSTVITRETYKNRQRCHIYSLASQMAHFFVEMLFVFTLNLLIIGSSVASYIFELAAVVKISSFGLLSIVQILSSSDFRSKLLSFLKKFKFRFTKGFDS